MTQKHLDKKLRSQFEQAQYHYIQLLLARDYHSAEEVTRRQAAFDGDMVNLRRLLALRKSILNQPIAPGSQVVEQYQPVEKLD